MSRQLQEKSMKESMSEQEKSEYRNGSINDQKDILSKYLEKLLAVKLGADKDHKYFKSLHIKSMNSFRIKEHKRYPETLKKDFYNNFLADKILELH